MAQTPDDRRLELLQGTLDMLILRTLQWGAQHGHGIGQAIRIGSKDALQIEHGSILEFLHNFKRRQTERSQNPQFGGRTGQGMWVVVRSPCGVE